MIPWAVRASTRFLRSSQRVWARAFPSKICPIHLPPVRSGPGSARQPQRRCLCSGPDRQNIDRCRPFPAVLATFPAAARWRPRRLPVGGSVVKGEDSLQGAIREAKEEVGVDLMPENGQVLFTKIRKIIEGKIFNDIMDVWLFEYEGEVDLGNATTDEVAQVAWMNREQIKELFDANMFVDTLEYFFTEVDKQ